MARVLIGAAFLTVLVAGGLPVAATAQGTEECPPIKAVDDLETGQTGHGITVAKGREREEFGVEILGVLPDGLGPGRDLIIIETSGDVIDSAGGIWYGISGSPVYIEDDLVGAVAFGLSYGPSHVAGVTPAEEMAKVLDYPAGSSSSYRQPNRVPLSNEMRKMVARASGASTDEVGGSMVRLRIPVGISGLPARAMDVVREAVLREKLPIVPFAGTSATAGETTSSEDIRPGDNLVAAMSYGDITFAGFGTATMVCEGRVIAFGHPFFWEGGTTLGANAGETLVVVKDSVFGSYEIGTTEEAIGTVDQDRYAGIRAIFGSLPTLIPVDSHVDALDTGRSNDGRTDVVRSEFLPFLAFEHLFANILLTVDEWDEGSSHVAWTITGETESGEAWSLERDNVYTSDYGIADASSYELLDQLFLLYYNDFEDISFSSVDLDASVEETVKEYKITDVLVSTDGSTFESRRRVRAAPGDTVFLRVALTPSDGGNDVFQDLQVTVPRRARSDGQIQISGGRGGNDFEICLYDPEFCLDGSGGKIDSFQELVTFLERRPKNSDLRSELRMGPRFRVKSVDSTSLDRVVSGRRRIRVRIPGACCTGVEEGEARPK